MSENGQTHFKNLAVFALRQQMESFGIKNGQFAFSLSRLNKLRFSCYAQIQQRYRHCRINVDYNMREH